ncbi:AMP-binding protein [bacterium]|nr:AMP-binding protein [bacterium]
MPLNKSIKNYHHIVLLYFMTSEIQTLKNLYELIEISSSRFPDRVALSEYKNNQIIALTYSELLYAIEKKSNEISKLAIPKGSNIALSGANSINWVITFFSILKVGHIVVPIDSKMNQQGMEFILNFTNTQLFIVDNVSSIKISDKFKTIIQEMDHVLIKLEAEENKNLQSTILLKNVTNINEEEKNDVAQILFTSGTTGEPKGVVLTHKNILSNIKDIHEILPTKNYEKSFSILPLHHVYELTCSLLHNLSKGNSIHFCSKIDLVTMVREMKIIKPTIWPVVPLILEKIYKNINKNVSKSLIQKILLKFAPKLFGYILRKKLGLKELGLLLSGGAALNTTVEKFFKDIGMTVTQGYGLSEASPLISVNPLGNERIGSVGKIIKSCEVIIENKNSLDHGVITVKGPNIFSGYYKNKEYSNQILKNGWLNTGDIGYMDSDGYLYITGRDKFVIVNKGGKNIYPEEIEEFFSSSSFIKDIIIFSNDDENIIALIRPDDELFEKESIDTIKKIVYESCLEVNQKLEGYKRIKEIYITNKDFEKTSTQKIKRSFLKNINLSEYISAK